MATIYKALGQDGYELCFPVDQGDFRTIVALMNGTRRGPSWNPLNMRLLRKDEAGRPRKESDAPWSGLSTALIFRPRAVAAMSALLLAHGELLPLVCEGAELSMLNVTRVLSAIDEEASGVDYLEDGHIRWVDRYVFHDDVIAGSDIFKLANMHASPTFVTRRFVDLWHASGLKGLTFTPALGTFRFS